MKPYLIVAAAAICCVSWAQDTETEVLFDGSSIAAWDTARGAERTLEEFTHNDLTSEEDPAHLRWRFASKGVAFNDIFLRTPVERPFSELRVRIRNQGAGLDLSAKVADDKGAEWTVPAVHIEPGDWRWVQFPREQWEVASWSRDPDGRLDLPLRYVTLIAFGVREGLEYDLSVAAVELVRPTPPTATVTHLSVPDTMQAGRRYEAAASFTLDKPCLEDRVGLEFSVGNTRDIIAEPVTPISLSAVAPGETVQLSFVIQVPQYVFGGRHAVRLVVGEAHISYQGRPSDEEVATVDIQQREVGKTVAGVRHHNGTPTIFINDEPQNGMAWATYRPTVEVFGDFTRAGVNLFTFSATPTEAGYGLSKTTWVAPDEYDYSQLDERVLMLLQANPDAYFFPRLYVHAPKWWSEQHPDDIVLMDDGSGNYVPFIHSGGKPAPSWASETWRRDTVEGLRRLIEHVEASPYADRIVGYHIASGTTEEWMMWGANENEWVDYSPVNVARFRQWLRDKYGTDRKLAAAWGDPEITFDRAAIPPKARRQESKLGVLRDPAGEQDVIDFYLYNSHLVADTINTFASAVKGFTNREKLVGVFYGYVLQLCGEQRQQNAGHLALGEVLACPDVDFLTSPTSYAFRQVGGEGTCHYMSLLDSVKLHGKIWFNEDDIRTSLTEGPVGSWGKPETVAEDILQQEKELAHAITTGSANWWFDVGGIRFDAPDLMARIGGLVNTATEAVALDRSTVDEVALLVDESSLCYLQTGHSLGTHLLLAQLPALHRIGAPVGHYLIGDAAAVADRKLFLVPTSFAPTAEDRAAVDALKRDGHVLLFLGYPGLYSDGLLNLADMEDFTGIALRLSREPARLQVTVDAAHALTEGLVGTVYGVGDVAPYCFANDPAATVLGHLQDGRAGLVVKDFGDWTAVYSSAPMLPTTLLRNVARAAGVHLYIDTPDVVWAARDLLAVCVKEPGPRRIALPREATVSDLYSHETVAEGESGFTADFGDRATRLFAVQ